MIEVTRQELEQFLTGRDVERSAIRRYRPGCRELLVCWTENGRGIACEVHQTFDQPGGVLTGAGQDHVDRYYHIR